MKLVAVKELPRTKQSSTKAGLVAIEEFLSNGYEKAKVMFYPDEYNTPFGVYASMSQHARKNKLPVKVTLRGNDI